MIRATKTKIIVFRNHQEQRQWDTDDGMTLTLLLLIMFQRRWF